jgi:hypothetical protein
MSVNRRGVPTPIDELSYDLPNDGGVNLGLFFTPVSSLDHMHREKVAKRLAEESAQRQVVVFTHDLAFLFLLDEAGVTFGNWGLSR